MNSHLSIRQLQLPIYLGWTEDERLKQQNILVDMDIGFTEPPKACVTDNLKDTFCYATLIEHLRSHLVNKKFYLIEHLSSEIYQLTKAFIPFQVKISVTITKHPPVSGLIDGISFSYGDTK